MRNGDDSIFDIDIDIDLVDHIDPAHNGAGCNVIVPNVEEWHARFRATGMPVSTVESQPWGIREFSVRNLGKGAARPRRASSTDGSSWNFYARNYQCWKSVR